MNEQTGALAASVLVGILTAVYWLVMVRSERATTVSMLALWGGFILVQMLGLLASFSAAVHFLVAMLFIFSFHKVSQVIWVREHQGQTKDRQPLELW